MPNKKGGTGGAPKGNNFAAGHKKYYTKMQHRFRDLLGECVTDEDFKKIVQKLIDTCLANNKRESIASIRILFEYIVGKPSTEIDVKGTLDAKETFAQIQKAIIENIGDVDKNADKKEDNE